ncbi:MAG: DUF3253 domain-containing protein [Pseudomonadota bacterium]
MSPTDNAQRPEDERIAQVILGLCEKRGADKTICPSEAARMLARTGGDWRAEMACVRRVGSNLMRQGLIAVTQRGHSVDPQTARGPIRFGLPRPRLGMPRPAE